MAKQAPPLLASTREAIARRTPGDPERPRRRSLRVSEAPNPVTQRLERSVPERFSAF